MAAVTVELVYSFSLLHDEMAHMAAGNLPGRQRRIAGDALLTLAFDVLGASGHVAAQAGQRVLAAVALNMLRGRHTDLALQLRVDITLAECQHTAQGRAGALPGCARWVGRSAVAAPWAPVIPLVYLSPVPRRPLAALAATWITWITVTAGGGPSPRPSPPRSRR